MNGAVKTPVHLWIVGVVSLLWNAMGALDYSMTELGNDAYLDAMGMTEELKAYIEGFPAWAVAGWAVGVWFCLAGSVLLLLRRRLAYPAFAISLLGIAVTTYYSYAYPHPAVFDSTGNMLFNLGLWVATIFLVLYSRAMAARGVLR